MSQFYRDPAHMTVFLENWIREELETSSAAGGVTGLNGETDSAVVAALLRRVCGRENMLAVIMPCRNPGEDERLSRLLAGTLDIPIKKVDLTEVYETMAGGIEASCGKLPDWAREGIKPRLRMTALYSLAHSRNFLVFGERNKDDIFCGRFTKYGEVGADALPLGDLLFGEVTALARYLGVPDEIIDRPGKGAGPNGETGVAYDVLDRYIATGNAETDVAIRIKEAYEHSQHKRNPVPIPAVPRNSGPYL